MGLASGRVWKWAAWMAEHSAQLKAEYLDYWSVVYLE